MKKQLLLSPSQDKRHIHSFKNYLLPLYISLVFAVFTGSAIGQTNTWIGTSGSNWNTAANWSLNLVPTPAHDVVINVTATIVINVSPAIQSLTISNSSNVIFTSTGTNRNFTIGSAVSSTASSIDAGSSLSI